MTTLIRWLVVADFEEKDSGSIREEIIVRGQISPYDPLVVESIVLDVVDQVDRRITSLAIEGKKPLTLQLSLRPILSGHGRPSFGLSLKALGALANTGISIDFDPY